MRRLGPLAYWLELLLDPQSEESRLVEAWWAITPERVLEELSAPPFDRPDGLETIWRKLHLPVCEGFLEYLFASAPEYHPFAEGLGRPAKDRLLGNLKGMVRGAMALSAASAGNHADAVQFVAESAANWGAPPTDPLMPGKPQAQTPLAFLLDAIATLWPPESGPWPLGATRLWLRRLEERRADARGEARRGESGPLASLSEPTFPLLVYRQGREGHVAWVTLTVTLGGSGDFCADPVAMALIPMTAEFNAATSLAWQTAASGYTLHKGRPVDISWRVEPDAFVRAPGVVLEGPSHGAAFASALVLLLRGDRWNSTLALTGELLQNGQVGPVRGVPEKTLAALKLQDSLGEARLKRVLVPQGNFAEAVRAAQFAGFGESAVTATRSLSAAANEASLLSEARQLLEGELNWILLDASNRTQRSFADWLALESFCVPVRLQREAAITEEESESVDGEDGAAVLGDVEAQWEQLRGNLRQAVILGAPGSGKTTLLWREAGSRCAGALSALESGGAQLNKVAFGVFIRAVDLAGEIEKTYREQDSDSLPALRAAARLIARRHEGGESIREFLRERIGAGACLLAVDGLDEVPGKQRFVLTDALNDLLRSKPQVRLLLASRRDGYARGALPIPIQSELEVRAFDDAQTQRAIRWWFVGEKEAAERFWTALRSHPGLRYVLRSPLLLRIACRAASDVWRRRGELPNWQRRSDLYETFLQEMLSDWQNREPGVTRTQREVFLDFAGDVALTVFRRRRDGVATGIESAVNEALRDYPVLVNREPLADLCSAGVMMFDGPAAEMARLDFTHQTFGEFLAARSLANRANRKGWGTISQEVDLSAYQPDWQVILVFLSGLLNDPLPLLETLADAQRDDVLRHRLAIAAQCLMEVVPVMSNAKGQAVAIAMRRG